MWHGPVAQLGAHYIRIVGVVGSNPIRSTNKKITSVKTGVIFLLTTEIPQTAFENFLDSGLFLRSAAPCSAGLYATCLVSIFIRVVPALSFKKDSYSLLQLIAKILKVFHADYVIADKRNDVVDKVCSGHLQLDAWISFVTSYPLFQLPEFF